MVAPGSAFWSKRSVLVTGHTGFKGAWLTLWLQMLGAKVTGVALAPSQSPSLFEAAGIASHLTQNHFTDILDVETLSRIVQQSKAEIVFHLAAQSLVLTGYKEPLRTFNTNVMGTAHVLEAIRGAPSVRSVVAITTDKVYENKEEAYPFRETDPLGGHDPYSASKAASEMVIGCYRASYLRDEGIALASARAGNVIGGGDWSENRLIPDAVRAWESGAPLHVRRPDAIRPWQHVLEPIAAYLHLAERLHHNPQLADAYNFGPRPDEAASVRSVIGLANTAYGRGDVIWGEEAQGVYEAHWLALETSKARHKLGISPRWSLEESVDKTMSWYRQFYKGSQARLLCESDIAAFCKTF